MKILVTGGAGFIGSAYVRRLLDQHPDDSVTVLDALTYAGNLANLEHPNAADRLTFIKGDISDADVVNDLVSESDAVVNFAAETHVDRSLLDSSAFVRANVTGVMTLLDAVRRAGCRLLHVSTDEVYGDIESGRRSAETDPLLPRSPYAAAKAGGEHMCHAYHVSYGVDVVITRGCNTLGPRQYPEKLIPLFITNAMRDIPLPVYGDGQQVRDWMHVDDHCAAIDLVLRHGTSGDAYNVGTGNERPNLDVITTLLRLVEKPESLIRFVEDRLGHDRRYALDASKIRAELGWSPAHDFDSALRDTVAWYLDNESWWAAIRDNTGEFADYYSRQYGSRRAESQGAPAHE